MALINCPECSREVSDQATACPQCGTPIKAQRVRTSEDSALTRNRGCGDIIIFGGIFAAALVLLPALIGSCSG